jgi:MFS family permease
MSYLEFLRRNTRFLVFGFALTFFSSFGQTYFIGVFGDDVRDAFGLTEGRYGTLYGAATLTSGCCVIWLGRLIDRVDLRIYTTAVCVGLIVACFAMSQAGTALALTVALFGLRLFGQGLLGHTAMTSMARYFDETRGKAMSVAALGFPAGEAVLPIAGVTLIAAVGWRQSWALIAGALTIAMVPIALTLLRGHGGRHRALVARTTESRGSGPERRDWTRREVMRDPRFYLLLPAILAPAFIVTGIFFHQSTLIAQKGWSATWFASCFIAFAGAQLPSSLGAGPLVDRVGATRLIPFYLAPLTASLVVLAAFDHPFAAAAFMVLAGITSGVCGPIIGAMWAELYGVVHLGAIRALGSALMVFSTALSPVAMGRLIDDGVQLDRLTAACAAGSVVAASLAALGSRLHGSIDT